MGVSPRFRIRTGYGPGIYRKRAQQSSVYGYTLEYSQVRLRLRFFGGVNCGEAGESGQPGYSPVAVHGRSATVNCQPPLTGLLQDNPNRRPLGRLHFTEIEFPRSQEAQMGTPANAGAAPRLLG